MDRIADLLGGFWDLTSTANALQVHLTAEPSLLFSVHNILWLPSSILTIGSGGTPFNPSILSFFLDSQGTQRNLFWNPVLVGKGFECIT